MLDELRIHRAFRDEQRPSSSGNDNDFDKVLFKNLVEMVPLVESLMDKRPRPSYTHRASLNYTPAPSSNPKSRRTKNRRTAQTPSLKTHRVDDSQADESSTGVAGEELISLREQVVDLQNKLLEKDEFLKSMENSMNEMKGTCEMVDELKQKLEEKDSAVKFAMSQLSCLKVQLADKQAKLEKLEWEAKTSNHKVEKLKGKLEAVEYEMSVFMQFLEEISMSNSPISTEENITYFENLDDLPDIDSDEDEMEDARRAYMDAISAAKENPNEETLCAAAAARRRLQAFVLQ